MEAQDFDTELMILNRPPLSEIAYDKILDLILSGFLKIDDKINIDELARLFKISKTPIREALKSLEKTGLVASTPYSGVYVKKLTVPEIREIYEIRIILESHVIGSIIANTTDEDIQMLERLQTKIEETIDSSYLNIYKLNRKFHDYIYNISKMPKFCELIGQLWDNLCFFRLLLARKENYAVNMIEEHHEYIDTIRNRNEEKLRYLTVSNLRRHADLIPKLVESYYNSIRKK